MEVERPDSEQEIHPKIQFEEVYIKQEFDSDPGILEPKVELQEFSEESEEDVESLAKDQPLNCFMKDAQPKIHFEKVYIKEDIPLEPGLKIVRTLVRCSQSDFRNAQGSTTQVSLKSTKTGSNKPYSCSKCDYRTTTSTKIKLHEYKHMGIKPFACNQCNYKSHFKRSLVNHMRKHTGDVFTCSVCDYRTTAKSNLVPHMRKHSGDLITCDRCDYKTYYKSNLVTHMKKHTGDLLTCKDCDYKTHNQGHLTRHVRSHNRLKP